jgi:hypothetical protein
MWPSLCVGVQQSSSVGVFGEPGLSIKFIGTVARLNLAVGGWRLPYRGNTRLLHQLG